MKIRKLPRFVKQYGGLPKHIREKVDKQLKLFVENPWHPSLRIRRRRGTRDIWYGRIDDDYRFTFSMEREVAILRTVGSHREVERDSKRGN